jgi:Sulfotransferase family
MPIFKDLRGLEVIRKVRSFLGRVVREESGPRSGDIREMPDRVERSDPQAQELKETRQKLARKNKEISELRTQLTQRSPGSRDYGINPENIVWIFGTGRSGSTWLASMMGEIKNHTKWNEPLVGALLGYFYYERAGHRADKGGKNYILGRRYKDTWVGPMRDLVLGGAAARFPELAEGGYVVIKEPNGSVGAPLLMEIFPESRMIFLVRDPRDVVASSIDSRKKGSWRYERRQRIGDARVEKAAEKIVKEADQFVRDRAEGYVQAIGNAKRAYEAHGGPKVLVRYEDLRADTLGTMKRLYYTLGIPVAEEELKKAVEKHSWENIPEEEKGEGKFYRKATPGGWREDLTKEQAETVERITAPLLKEFYTNER